MDMLSRTLVDFSRDGAFPEEESSKSGVESSMLLPALEALSQARAELENEVKALSRESASDVDAWIENAKRFQDDIDNSRSLANEIVRLDDAGGAIVQELVNVDTHYRFLLRERSYNEQVSTALRGIKSATIALDRVEAAGAQNMILDALHLLENAISEIAKIPSYATAKPVKLLDRRVLDLRNDLHEHFDRLWKVLVEVNHENHCVHIQKTLDNGGLDIENAIIVMKAFREFPTYMKHLADDLEALLFGPRIDLCCHAIPMVHVTDNKLLILGEHDDRTLKGLFVDLEKVITYLSENLPVEISMSLSDLIMPKLIPKIKTIWLNTAVPTSLDETHEYRKVLAVVLEFVEILDKHKWVGGEEFSEWVSSAPKLWLTKRKEQCLDETRIAISSGVGHTTLVERCETQEISREEGQNITATGQHDDWDAAWSDGEEASAETTESVGGAPSEEQNIQVQKVLATAAVEDEEEEDAWGWGDGDDPAIDEVTEEVNSPARDPVVLVSPIHAKHSSTKREVTLTEHYQVSSMPGSVLKNLSQILDDGAALTQPNSEENPVTAAAAGLFGLPTLVLALYRAVSPYYYSQTKAGNMYLYNDSIWLAEQLRELENRWRSRDDLTPRAYEKVKFAKDIESLESFGRRGYAEEMNMQRTVITDLLGGAQNIFSTDERSPEDIDIAIETITTLIRGVAQEWQPILSNSAWTQAIGSLLTTLCQKIILDVADLNSLSSDLSFHIASLISKIVKLDDLFTPPKTNGTNGDAPLPVTSQYVPQWLKLQFLSEILQSELKDVKYLWFESDLSLYFSSQEVVDLIEVSFEHNSRTRQAIIEIKNSPMPRGTMD